MATVVKSLTASLASNGTLSEAVQLGELGYTKVYLQVPTMSTAAAVRVYGSPDNSTFNYIQCASNTATQAINTLIYDSGANGYFAEMNQWMPYMKFQVTGTVCVATNFRVFCVLDR